MSGPIIEVEAVSKTFGGNTAISGLSLQIARGRLTGIIGPNGAGKTTLLNLITCLYRPSQGRILVDGHDVRSLKPHELARRRITRTFQNLQIFGRLTVRENLLVAAQARSMDSLWAMALPTLRRRRLEERWHVRSEEILRQVRLESFAGRMAGDLPYGMLKRLELARAIALEPICVLLDEPAAGCNPTEANDLIAIIRLIADGGVTVVMVEHNMKLVMALCEHIFVLDGGTLLFEGAPDAVRANPGVIAAYLGYGNTRAIDAQA